ncbi:hypothetical protein RZS28_05065 [Methylocapsa polymorpha]|uniref:Uncharacterized protein n=1 Tax=Methylocapsa polymorpha TaxID=3080828 RepID=A0ABZ0HW68_9HYPH|nr:hypothetical protein RZS28_05065 [Methylocapsa sp. RX1]
MFTPPCKQGPANRFGAVNELIILLWTNKRWWAIPAVVVFVVFGAALALPLL